MGSTFTQAGKTYDIPDDAGQNVNAVDLQVLNQQRTANGASALTPAQYDVISGDYARRNANRQTQAAVANNTYKAPESANSGLAYKYTMDNTHANDFIALKRQNPNLTEYGYRKEHNVPIDTVAGNYTSPVGGSNQYIAARTGSGDQKFAAMNAANTVNNSASAKTGTAQTTKATAVSAKDNQAQKNADAQKKQQEADRAAEQARQAAAAQKAAEQEAIAKQKAAAIAKAEARRSADAEVKANAEKTAKEAVAAQSRAKAAKEAANKTADYADVLGTVAYYTTQAKGGSVVATQKAADASKKIKPSAREAAEAVRRAEVTGVDFSNHTGQIQLKDGTWINQIERKGSASLGEREIVTFNESVKGRAEAKRFAAKQGAELQALFNEVKDKSGKVIDAIEKSRTTDTGEADVRVTVKDSQGNITAISKSASQYALAKQQSLKSDVPDQKSKTGSHDAEWDREIELNDAQQKSSNIIVRNLAKFDRLVGDATMKMATNTMTGAHLALGKQVSNADYTLLQKTTGVGTEKTYSPLVAGIAKEYGNATLFSAKTEKAIIGSIEKLENFRQTKVNSALRAVTPDSIERSYAVIKQAPGFVGNSVRSVENADKIVPSVIVATNGVPKIAVGALQALEVLAKNPDYILPTVAFAAGSMVAGTAKDTYEDPVKTAAYFAVQDAAFKGIVGVTKKVGVTSGRATGLVRDKTVVIKNEPYHPVESQGALIDAVISNDKISGTRGTQVHYFAQSVQRTDDIKPIGIDTFKLPGSSKEYTLGSTLRKLGGIKEQTLTRFRTEGRTGTEYAADVHSSYMVPDLTEGKFETVGGHFIQKGSGSKLKQNVQILEDIPTVASELTAKQKALIREQFSTRGQLDPSLLKEIQKLAEAKSARINQPVATITPKTASGFYKPESEVLLVFGNKAATEITSSQFAGFTAQGVKIKKIRFGAQDTIKKRLVILENLKYNVKNVVTRKDAYNAGMAVSQNRKLSEMSGNALMKPGQYGPHGADHIDAVVVNAEKIWRSSKTLQNKYSLEEFKVAARLHDSGRVYGSSKFGDTEPVGHGQSVAANIRKGRITDAELLALPKAAQLRVAAAIDTHMWIKPLPSIKEMVSLTPKNTHYRAQMKGYERKYNKWVESGKIGTEPIRPNYFAETGIDLGQRIKTILTNPSDFQKAIATSDRLARAANAGYVKKGMTFKIPEETTMFKVKASVNKGFDNASKSRLMADTGAELFPRKTVSVSSRRASELKGVRKQGTVKNLKKFDEYKQTPRTTKKAGEYSIKTKESRKAEYVTHGEPYNYGKSAKVFNVTLGKLEGYAQKAKSDDYLIQKTKLDEDLSQKTKTGVFGRYKMNSSEYSIKNRGYKPKIDGKYTTTIGTGGRYTPAPKGDTYKPTPRGESYKPTPQTSTPKAGSGYSNGGSGSTYGGLPHSGTHAVGYQGKAASKRRHIADTAATALRKKKTEQKEAEKRTRGVLRVKRTIRNTLGSMETMFGSEPVKKSTKRKSRR